MKKVKEKPCRICKTKFLPYKSTDVICSEYDCRVSYALQVHEKQKAAKEKEQKSNNAKEKSILKESLKTLADWKNDFQKDINSIIRALDNGWGCIATKTPNGKMNAGHYISVGSNGTLRFHLENIWLQSEHSNTWKSGDTLRYQEGIVRLYGKDYLDYMNALQSIEPIKLTIADIKEKIPIARGILKWIKLQDRQFTLSERVEYRKKFNQEIGIYN